MDEREASLVDIAHTLLKIGVCLGAARKDGDVMVNRICGALCGSQLVGCGRAGGHAGTCCATADPGEDHPAPWSAWQDRSHGVRSGAQAAHGRRTGQRYRGHHRYRRGHAFAPDRRTARAAGCRLCRERADVILIANAGDGSVRLFSAKDFLPAGSVPLGDDADNVRIDPRNGLAVVGYGNGGLALIEPARTFEGRGHPIAGAPGRDSRSMRGPAVPMSTSLMRARSPWSIWTHGA